MDGIPDELALMLTQKLHESLAATLPTMMRKLLAEAYQAGVEAGQVLVTSRLQDFLLSDPPPVQMRQAAPALGPLATYEAASKKLHGIGAKLDRAPRGAVRDSIVEALRARPGLNERELGEAMERLNPKVSGRSAGGELRRLKGRLYRQEGGRWFLMGEAAQAQKETAEPQGPAGSLNLTAQEDSDVPATIAA